MNPVCAFSVRFVQLRYFYGSKRRSIITSAGFSWVIFKNFIFIKGDKIDVWSCKWSKEVRKSYRSMPMSRFRPDKRYANWAFLFFSLPNQEFESRYERDRFIEVHEEFLGACENRRCKKIRCWQSLELFLSRWIFIDVPLLVCSRPLEFKYSQLSRPPFFLGPVLAQLALFIGTGASACMRACAKKRIKEKSRKHGGGITRWQVQLCLEILYPPSTFLFALDSFILVNHRIL